MNIKYPSPSKFEEVMEAIFKAKDELINCKEREGEALKKLARIRAEKQNANIDVERAYDSLNQFRK